MAEVAPPPAQKLLVAVLAAGRATRFGGGKLDAPCAGKPLGRWPLDAVAGAGLEPGVIVVPPDAPAFARVATGWELATNPAPERGLGSSLALAARLATARRANLLVLLADMPLIDAAFLRRLVATAPPAATRYPDGRPGVPALLSRRLLARLAALTGDSGAGVVLAATPGLSLVAPAQGALLDVDRPADMERIEAMLRARDDLPVAGAGVPPRGDCAGG